MAVPARRTSKMRKNTRRAHDSLSVTTTTNCLDCGAITKPHHACGKCKTYKGQSYKPLFSSTSLAEKK